MNQTVINLLCAFLGFTFITIKRMESLKKDAQTANIIFSYKKYFEVELLAIISSFLSIFLWQLLFPEVSAKYPVLIGWTRGTFVACGAMGSYILQSALGKTKKWVRDIVDTKTNIADKVVTSTD